MLKLWKLYKLNRDRNLIYKYIKIENGLPGSYYDYKLTAYDILNKILKEENKNKNWLL